jgi:hypothetical protein
MRTDIPLAQLARIDRPCPMRWSELRGGARRRYCDYCHKDVHNLSALTESQARELLTRREGELCCRYVRDEAGAPITRDRPIKLLLAKMAALVAVIAPFLSGCTTTGKARAPVGQTPAPTAQPAPEHMGTPMTPTPEQAPREGTGGVRAPQDFTREPNPPQ